MRLIIKDNYNDCSLWAANYIAYKIQTFRPTPKNRSFWACPPDQPRSAHTVN